MLSAETMNAILEQIECLAQIQLIELSNELDKFQKYFQRLGMNELFIIGGAARGILDAYYHNANLSIRDLDIAFVIGHEADEKEIWKLAEGVEQIGLGKNISPEIRRKDWLHPVDCPKVYTNHGYGFHLKTQSIPIVSLSFYFSHHALESIGFFSFDTTMIRVPSFASLIDALEMDNCVIDPKNGYNHWRQRQLVFLKADELIRDAVKASFRIIRSYAKLNTLSIPNDLLSDMKREVGKIHQKSISINQFEFVRSILKILNDQNYLWELETITSLGILDLVPNIKEKLENGNFHSWVNDTYPFLDVHNP